MARTPNTGIFKGLNSGREKGENVPRNPGVDSETSVGWRTVQSIRLL